MTNVSLLVAVRVAKRAGYCKLFELVFVRDPNCLYFLYFYSRVHICQNRKKLRAFRLQIKYLNSFNIFFSRCTHKSYNFTSKDSTIVQIDEFYQPYSIPNILPNEKSKKHLLKPNENTPHTSPQGKHTRAYQRSCARVEGKQTLTRAATRMPISSSLRNKILKGLAALSPIGPQKSRRAASQRRIRK